MAQAISRHGHVFNLEFKPTDRRDIMKVARIAPQQLPEFTENRKLLSYTYDQGRLGSCTGNGISKHIDYTRVKQGLPIMQPSRLQIYYNERQREGTIGEDSGANIGDGIAAVYKQGYCPEAEWPYDISKFTVAPPPEVVADALKNTIKQYEWIDNTVLDKIKSQLAEGLTFVFGIKVFESFESDEVAATGIVPMPDLRKERCLGGHCIAGVDFDNTKAAILCDNSWGENWGFGGKFWLPYSYITNTKLANDLCCIELAA